MIAKVCDRESRRDSWFENRLVSKGVKMGGVKGNLHECEGGVEPFLSFPGGVYLASLVVWGVKPLTPPNPPV